VDARYCSSACRKRAHRAREGVEEDELPSRQDVGQASEPDALNALATRARKKADEYVRLGRGREAQAMMTTAAIAIDKARVLRKEQREQHEFDARIAEEQARQLGGVITAILTDLGHDLDEEGTRKIVRMRLLEGGGAGEPPKPLSREAAKAHAERARIAQLKRATDEELVAELRRRHPAAPSERPALPAPLAPHPDGRAEDEREARRERAGTDQMIPPVGGVKTSRRNRENGRDRRARDSKGTVCSSCGAPVTIDGDGRILDPDRRRPHSCVREGKAHGTGAEYASGEAWIIR
jgi:hypothetical protein